MPKTNLNNAGFSHLLVAMAVVVACSIGGVAYIVAGHAHPANHHAKTKHVKAKKNKYTKFKKPSSSTMKKISKYALEYWNHPTMCRSGRKVHYTYYNRGQEGKLPESLRSNILGHFWGENPFTSPFKDLKHYQTDTLAYARLGGGDSPEKTQGHCHIYFNQKIMKGNYNEWSAAHATNLNPRQYVCMITVHEFGHLVGYGHTFDTRTDAHLEEDRLTGDRFYIMQTNSLVAGWGAANYAHGCVDF